MAKETPIINIFTYGLPYKLANQIYKEYDSRLREAIFIITESKRYASLKDSMQTVELLLALSIFDKRVISNLQAGVKFYSTVSSYSESETIQIGTYRLTGEEKILPKEARYFFEVFFSPARYKMYKITATIMSATTICSVILTGAKTE